MTQNRITKIKETSIQEVTGKRKEQSKSYAKLYM